MNLFLLLATALSVSADSFFCGLATYSKEKKDKTNFIYIILTVFFLCSLGTLLANSLMTLFVEIAEPLGGSILALVAIYNFFIDLKSEITMLNQSHYCRRNMIEGFVIGSAIGIDGAIGCFTLSLSGLGGLKAPLLVTFTHYILLEVAYHISNTKIGQKLSKYKITAPVILLSSGFLKIFKYFCS